jgi:hypothetical protein
LEVFEDSFQKKVINEELFNTWIELQVLSGEFDKVRQITEKAFRVFPKQTHFILIRIQLEIYQAGVAYGNFILRSFFFFF